MTNRRVWLSSMAHDGRTIATCEGLAGEEFDSEVYQTYGLSVNHEGEGFLIEAQGKAANHIALPPRGDRLGPENSLLIYYGDKTEIELIDGKITIRVDGGLLEIDGKKIKTDMDIETSGDVKAGTISLRNHKHTGVQAGAAITGPAQ